MSILQRGEFLPARQFLNRAIEGFVATEERTGLLWIRDRMEKKELNKGASFET